MCLGDIILADGEFFKSFLKASVLCIWAVLMRERESVGIHSGGGCFKILFLAGEAFFATWAFKKKILLFMKLLLPFFASFYYFFRLARSIYWWLNIELRLWSSSKAGAEM